SSWTLFAIARDVRVVGEDGVVRWSLSLDEEGQPLSPEAQAALRGGDDRWGDAVVRPLGGAECGGCHLAHAMDVGKVVVHIDQPNLRRAVGSVFGSAVMALVAFSILLLGAAALSMHLVLAVRMKRLSEAMARAGGGDYLVRADERGDDEIAQLSAAFNRMLATLTSLKAEELEANRGLLEAREQLSLKAKLEATNAQLESRLQELSTLYDVARSFTATLDLPEILARISTLIAEHLQIPRFSIMLSTPDGRLEVKTAYPPGQGTEGVSFRWGEGACGMAALELKSIYLADVAKDRGIFLRREGQLEAGSLLAVPMIHKDQLLGVLNFQRPERAGFSAEEIDLLTAVADQAALAVKNARLHEEMRSLSLTDALTGAPNRRQLFANLEMEIARAHRFGTQVSVLMIDVDHFKLLNDTAGHRAGDVVLRQLYELMSRMIRRVDTFARYGGEEFMVLLPQVPKANACEVGEKLRRAVEEVIFPHGKTQPDGRLTISVGVANLPVDATTLERLADCVDAALYASKRGGRNLVTPYAPGMEQHPGRERRDGTKAAISGAA
ncbi:MAG TPA: diguanylate cyclase, partial [Myxococcaceae bacterium]